MSSKIWSGLQPLWKKAPRGPIGKSHDYLVVNEQFSTLDGVVTLRGETRVWVLFEGLPSLPYPYGKHVWLERSAGRTEDEILIYAAHCNRIGVVAEREDRKLKLKVVNCTTKGALLTDTAFGKIEIDDVGTFATYRNIAKPASWKAYGKEFVEAIDPTD